MNFRQILTALIFVHAWPAAATAALQTQIVASGLNQPLFVTAPAGDRRLFIVEKAGRIKVLEDGIVLATPYLDLTAVVDAQGERGLLGMAFDPGFTANRRFFVHYIDKTTFNSVVAVYEAPTVLANTVDASSGQVVITVTQPAGRDNHKAGWIGFRPGEPNNLYIATGDGGSGNDPENRAQNLSDNLGKILRVDVSLDRFPGDAARFGYAIPGDNPFASGGGNPEIYAYGLRNPFRNSFDRETGVFYVADVGQGAREEIDIGVIGANYGWRKFEGTQLNFAGDPPIANHTPPIHEYASNGAAVTGGYVYRGTRIAGLQGTYFFADFIKNFVMSFRYTGSGIVDRIDRTAELLSAGGIAGNVASFGEDGFGNLYLVSLNGNIGRVIGIALGRSDFGGDGKSDIFWRNVSTGQNAIWRMDGTGVIDGPSLPTVQDVRWRIAAIGDVNGDTRADVIWRNVNTGDNALWLMNESTVTTSVLLPSVTGLAWTIVGVGDFNGDGRADVFWRNTSTGENVLWMLDGTVVADSAFVPTVTDTHWFVAGIADLDGNGKADVLWRNGQTGELVVWLMNGFSIAASASLGIVATRWLISGVADFDGDGKSDILWRDTASNSNAMWLMDGVTPVREVFINSVPGAGRWTVAATGDYDGDGRADILWRNNSDGENEMWLMDGFAVRLTKRLSRVNDQNWVIIRP